MKIIDKYIEIVASSNSRLNAMSVETQLSIQAVLSKQYEKVEITIVNDLSDLKVLVAKQPDLVVLGMKLVLLEPNKGYKDSSKVWLSDYLNSHGIAFTGSDKNALESGSMNKHVAKQAVLDAGLASPRYFISGVQKPQFKHDLIFPLFVKPTNRGGGKGIDEQSLVYTDSQLKDKIVAIHSVCKSDALVEEYLPGREFSIAVIKKLASTKLIALPIEITMPADKNGNSFLSESVKKADTEAVAFVADAKIRKAINNHAIGVFKALQSRDYGRIDVRLDVNGEPHFIEANLTPGLSDHGYLSRCFKLNMHATYDEMILSIVELAMERAVNRTQTRTAIDILQETEHEVSTLPSIV